MTNHNYRVTTHSGDDYVVRIGRDLPEHGVMRFNELAAARAAHAAGISPEVVFAADGVLVSRSVSPMWTSVSSPAPIAVSNSNEPGEMNSPKRVPGVTIVPGSTDALTTTPSKGAVMLYLPSRSYSARIP